MTGEKNSKQKIVEKINVIIILIECEIYMILKSLKIMPMEHIAYRNNNNILNYLCSYH